MPAFQRRNHDQYREFGLANRAVGFRFLGTASAGQSAGQGMFFRDVSREYILFAVWAKAAAKPHWGIAEQP